METQKIIDKLNDLKSSFDELKKQHHSKGEKKFDLDRQIIERIIDRIYPEKDAKELKSKLVHKSWIISGNETDEYWQKFYLTKIDLTMKVINTILEEYKLFGWEDFNPIKKEAIETSKEKVEDKKERHQTTCAIFLSHAKKDRKLAKFIKELLKDFNITSFIAHEDIEEGEIWEPRIIQTIRNSNKVIVLGTKEIENSAWVNFETGLAYDSILPVLFNKLSDKISYIKNKQGIIIDYENINKSLIKLIKMALSQLKITTERTEKLMTSLKSFEDLKEFILKEYKPKVKKSKRKKSIIDVLKQRKRNFREPFLKQLGEH